MELDKKKGKSLQVKIIQGAELDKPAKINEQTSSFVTVQYGDITKQTPKIYGTANPTWLQTLTFDLTPIRKIKINVFYQSGGKKKRIGKIKQEFDPNKPDETTYTQKLTRGKLIYSLLVAQESLQSTSQPIIPPNPNTYSDVLSSDDEDDTQIGALPTDPEPIPKGPEVQRVFQALQPSTPNALLKSLAEMLAPKVPRTAPRGSTCGEVLGAAIGDAICQACFNVFCYLLLIVCIALCAIFVLVTRFM